LAKNKFRSNQFKQTNEHFTSTYMYMLYFCTLLIKRQWKSKGWHLDIFEDGGSKKRIGREEGKKWLISAEKRNGGGEKESEKVNQNLSPFCDSVKQCHINLQSSHSYSQKK